MLIAAVVFCCWIALSLAFVALMRSASLGDAVELLPPSERDQDLPLAS